MRKLLLHSCVISGVLVLSGHPGRCEPGPAMLRAAEQTGQQPEQRAQSSTTSDTSLVNADVAQAKAPATSGADRRKKRAKRQAVAAYAAGQPARLRRAGRTTQADAVNTWLIFGFTEGSDTGLKGERTAFHESVIRMARVLPGYGGWDSSWGVTYSTSDSVVLWVAGSAAFEENAVGPSSPVSTRGFGTSAGLKYQILQRGPSPIGLAVQFAPYWQRVDAEPFSREAVGSEFRLLIDRALASERLFGAFNLAYQPERTTSSLSGVANRSNLEMSGAITGRVLPDVFVGGELRYVNTYLGHFLNDRLGWAVFAGPTLYLGVGTSAYLGIAWSAQLAGKSFGDENHLDLVHFERHQVRLKFGFAF